MSMDRVFDGEGLWSYLFGTGEPPKQEEAEHEQLEHMHWDRRSHSWIAVAAAQEDVAA
jgi:hypothetical protein